MRKRKETSRESKERKRKAAELKERRRQAEEQVISQLVPIFNRAVPRWTEADDELG